MRISVLGTGTVGQALSEKLSELGHDVFLGTRDPEKTVIKTERDAFGNPPISEWLKANPRVQLLTFREAVEIGSDLIVFAIGGQAAFSCLELVGADLLSEIIMIDISNPLDFSKGFPPTLSVSNTDSLGEQIQRKYPSLKVVKTLNTMSNPVMVNPKAIDGEHTVFMSGNDAAAKASVIQLLQEIGWSTNQIMDLGDISTARGTEMILPLWLRLFGKLQTPFFNFNVNFKQQ